MVRLEVCKDFCLKNITVYVAIANKVHCVLWLFIALLYTLELFVLEN